MSAVQVSKLMQQPSSARMHNSSLSFILSFSLSLSHTHTLSLLYHLSRFPKNGNQITHQSSPVTHTLSLFQEHWRLTSWFGSLSKCLIGPFGETQRKSEWHTNGANLISGQFSNSNLSPLQDCKSSWINSQKQKQAVWGVADSQIPLLTWDKTETRLSQAAGHNPTF